MNNQFNQIKNKFIYLFIYYNFIKTFFFLFTHFILYKFKLIRNQNFYRI